jgi:hypothetical protein
MSDTDLELMSDAARWPLRPRLPLTRDVAGGWPELGFLCEGQGAKVFLGDVVDNAESCESLSYVSFAAAVADGWRVD